MKNNINLKEISAEAKGRMAALWKDFGGAGKIADHVDSVKDLANGIADRAKGKSEDDIEADQNSAGVEPEAIKKPGDNARDLGEGRKIEAVSPQAIQGMTEVFDRIESWVDGSKYKSTKVHKYAVLLRATDGSRVRMQKPSLDEDGHYTLQWSREPTWLGKVFGQKSMRIDYAEQAAPSPDNGDIAYTLLASVGDKEELIQMGSYHEAQVFAPPLNRNRKLFDKLIGMTGVNDAKHDPEPWDAS